jgi:hypothetical protein
MLAASRFQRTLAAHFAYTSPARVAWVAGGAYAPGASMVCDAWRMLYLALKIGAVRGVPRGRGGSRACATGGHGAARMASAASCASLRTLDHPFPSRGPADARAGADREEGPINIYVRVPMAFTRVDARAEQCTSRSSSRSPFASAAWARSSILHLGTLALSSHRAVDVFKAGFAQDVAVGDREEETKSS